MSNKSKHGLPSQKWDFLFVEWLDSRATCAGWTSIDELSEGSLLVISTGWLLDETDESIHICANIADDPLFVTGSMRIPKCSITRRVLIKEGVPDEQ